MALTSEVCVNILLYTAVNSCVRFHEDKLPQLSLLVKINYPSLSDKAMKVLFRFVITYLSKTGFSAVAVMKTNTYHG
jgi:hypothetical protein